MTIANFFKQIKAVLAEWKRQMHKRHLSFAQRIDGRVDTYVIQELESDCPQQITDAYQAYHAAVEHEDDVYKQATTSSYTEQIQQADATRDNTWSGVMNYLDFMRRLGTDQQKQAAQRLIQSAEFYGIKNNSKYEDQNTDTMQWIQQCEGALASDVTAVSAGSYIMQLKTETQAVITLIGQRNAEMSQIDPKAMSTARQATEDAYVKLVGIINAHAITEYVQGISPYDRSIDYINADIDYYVDKVFAKDKKLKTLKVGDATFTYLQGETWAEAISEHPTDNAGWTVSPDDEVLYGELVLTAGGDAVSATSKVATGDYTLEGEEPQPDDQGGGGSDVTPVTPE